MALHLPQQNCNHSAVMWMYSFHAHWHYMFPTSNGVPYLGDGADLGSGQPKPRSLWLQALLFAAVFFALQAGYNAVRDTWVERLVIDTLTVKSAAQLIRTVTPSVTVEAAGTRLKAPGGGINILNGCEGTEVLFLLYAAFAAAALPWRARLTGALAGTALVFVLNQGRILALFYAYRADKAWFDLLHGTVAPLLLIALSASFFLFWLNRYGPSETVDPRS